MGETNVVAAKLGLLEALAGMFLAEVRDLRAQLGLDADGAEVFRCGHPRAGALDVTSLGQTGRALMCRACGRVTTELEAVGRDDG